ncbi:melatonin receptor type 1A-like isoform X2 [Amphibalanus amphitrite]|uniref:melatonin receptor type 1A-like isoform X2 n=1 Tax=Amphibalanus amphitrite TaxID=1232801 RepID=UPI001C9171F4|nr:melatonin receptor type 1A-like isoform X2 [Amphibalanus amphitrite]XP_043197822.1 melatonin receptor type 1A-like isoform X2 [Amphibalanus amphitrite]
MGNNTSGSGSSSLYGNGSIGDISHRYPTPFVIALSIIIVVFMIVSVTGNILVILSVCRFRSMRTRTNLFLVNLAVTDVLAALVNMPVALVTLTQGRWVFGEVLCQLNGFTFGLGTMASIHTMMHISIHKYISMARPFSRFMTRRRIVVILAAAWLWSIFYNLTPQLELTHTVYKEGATQCGPAIPRDSKQHIHSAVNSTFNFFLPLGVMLFCYTRIFVNFRQHLNRMGETSNMAERRRVLQQQRIAVTLFLVLACFLLCHVPYIVYSTGLVYAGQEHMPIIMNPISYWCIYMNSALNPITYGARCSAFRDSYRDILLGRRRSQYGGNQGDCWTQADGAHYLMARLRGGRHGSVQSALLLPGPRSSGSIKSSGDQNAVRKQDLHNLSIKGGDNSPTNSGVRRSLWPDKPLSEAATLRSGGVL